MDAVIGLLACLVFPIAGIIGLITPSKVKLANRWQAATLLSGFIPVVGILMFFFPGNPTPPQTVEVAKGVGIGLAIVWLVIVGITWGIRKLITRSNPVTAETAKFAPARLVSSSDKMLTSPPTAPHPPPQTNEAPKVGIMRSLSTAFDSSLHADIVNEIKRLPNVATVDETALATAYHVPQALVSNLVGKARNELLEEHLAKGFAARSLVEASARQHSLSLGLLAQDFGKAWDKFRKVEAKAFLESILKDGQITPDEAKDLDKVRTMLQADYSSRSREIEEARKMWMVCNAPLEQIDAPLMMKRGEVCYGWDVVSAFEIRTRTKAISYGGPSLRVPIAKGLSFRIGHSRIARQKEEHQHSFGTGDLCVTNKRLIWSGPNRTFNIPYGKIVNIDPFNDGITIHKDTGKPLSFDYRSKNKTLSALILRVADECR
jgi:hypothetical protein